MQSRSLVRLEYGTGTATLPSFVARPSLVPGRERTLRIRYNAAGQAVERIEQGWTPGIDGGAPQQIARTTALSYVTVNGRSLLAGLDGALANGPSGQPADSDITLLSWDASGSRVTGVIAPGDLRSRIDYDQTGRMTQVTDEGGGVARAGFDAQGRLMSLSRAGVQHSLRFDAAGNLVEQGKDGGDGYRADKRYGYDAAGRTAWVASALGFVSRMEYDSEDRLVKSVRGSARFSRETAVRYDALGRPVEVDEGDGVRQRVDWDARDLPVAIHDALGRALQLEHDSEGELVRSTPAANVRQLMLAGRSTRYEHDADGEVAAVTAGNGTLTRYVRDDFGRTVAVASADSGRTTYRYDAADRLEQTCEADGACASLRYDAAGRIVQRTVTDSAGAATTTRWRYAGRRLVAIDDAAQSEAYAYDAGGALATRTVTLHRTGGGSIASAVTYRYDGAHRLAAMSLVDGSELVYRRNGQGQVVALERQRIRTSWLRWLLPTQTVVDGLERDTVGLKRVRYGNGLESLYRRAPSGRLASIVVRTQPVPAKATVAEGLLGIGQARAATPAAPAGPAAAWDGRALLERRFWWDAQGNLLFTREPQAANDYAYDAQDRLIASSARDARTGQEDHRRYFADGIGNRLLGQEQGSTSAGGYQDASSRPLDADRAGRQEGVAANRYIWQAGGLLAGVSRGAQSLVSFRYNYRGERVEKRGAQGSRYYLYENRKLAAELDKDGRLLRQYIYLGEQPIALLDDSGDASAPALERGRETQLAADLATAWRAWVGGGARLAWLHNNHLGATEVVTGEAGEVLWQARYHAFGRPVVLAQRAGFRLDLRLPGQLEDEETGLFYNDHRYYDPDTGRYISPDPLGLRGGINSYAYARGNPLRFIDPSGLLLFAFDGTNNSDPAMGGNDLSNVVKFREAYIGDSYYITGIGTTRKDMQYKGNDKSGDGIDQRLDLAFRYLSEHIQGEDDTDVLTIDVIGFSRGAATARAWVNQLRARLTDGAFVVGDKARCIDFNFAGLWDTVPHFGWLNGNEKKYDFSIPPEMNFAAHANALNEHRGGAANFHSPSILENAGAEEVYNRIERAFLGAHSDIGGSYGTGDLSDIALIWMIEQAREVGLEFNREYIKAKGWDVVTEPIIHDSRNKWWERPFYGSDRTITYADGSKVIQMEKDDVSRMTYRDTLEYIKFRDGVDSSTAITGDVDLKGYCEWLNSQKYFKEKTICDPS